MRVLLFFTLFLLAEEASLVEKTKEVTGGGIDASVDYVGITKTLNRCFQAARKVKHFLDHTKDFDSP